MAIRFGVSNCAQHGTTDMKWTETERKVLVDAEANGVKASELVLSGAIPGRSATDVQNQFGLMRARARKICVKCRKPSDAPSDICDSCKNAIREQSHKWKADGLCSVCGNDRSGGSATLCTVCHGKSRDRRPPYLKKYASKNPKKSDKNPRIIPHWPRTRHCGNLAKLVAPEDSVVDLFGGCGMISLAVHRNGGKVARWNDIHPVLPLVMGMVKSDPKSIQVMLKMSNFIVSRYNHVEIADMYRVALSGNATWDLPPLLHAMSVVNHGKLGAGLGSDTRPVARYKCKIPTSYIDEMQAALSGTTISNTSYESVLAEMYNPDTVFLMDPPWPGAGGGTSFEYPMDGSAFSALLAAVLKLRFARWAIVVQSSDLTVRSLAAAGVVRHGCRTAWLYSALAKEILITSPGWDTSHVGRDFDLGSLTPL